MATAEPILQVENLSKRYGAVQALNDVSFELGAGEVVGLVGDNGAGKSTLVGVVSGSVKPDRGRILVAGVEQHHGDATHARDRGIETVFQQLALIPTLDIAANIYLNREVFRFGAVGRALRLMAKRRMRRDTATGLERLGLALPAPSTAVGLLSGGQRQTVAIARAVFWKRRIVLLDEPAAALGVGATEFVLSFIERLKREEIGVVFISHNMDHVLRLADRVIVLRHGTKVYDGARAELNGTKLVHLMTGVVGELNRELKTGFAEGGDSTP